MNAPLERRTSVLSSQESEYTKMTEDCVRNHTVWMDRMFRVGLVVLTLWASILGSAAGAQDTAAQDAAPGTLQVTPSAAPVEGQSPLPGLILLAIVIALLVIPMLLGGYLSKRLRMPDHGWKFALAIGTVAAAVVVLYEGEFKYGPDLSGGITLIYELQQPEVATGEGTSPSGNASAGGSDVVRKLISALRERVDPSGTKEVTIREYGLGQIEIIIPKASPAELDYIERKISTAGALEFRITASPVFAENQEIIELAKALPPGVNEVRLGGKKVAEWVLYDEKQLGPFSRPDDRFAKRMAGELPQALVLTNDGLDVTGDYLTSASAGFDETGQPEVRFSFNEQGAFRFGQLTGQHLPNPSGQKYYLGIILDKKLLSAPSINSKITSSGRINGINSQKEVDFIVDILESGSLPASLNKDPISRNTISPTLGAETVRKGKTSIVYSLVVSLVFMVFYYRFAGLVASLALGANLLLTLGTMVLLHAAFTLPGLAGLVLSIGMSVDANVLIFERIREELKRGAALRMAIRNGFDRAMTTIVDANLTNLITAVVIYKIAPDNVKGFGVTLIIGIIMSMYAAVFLSRIIFDVAERSHRLRKLTMAQIIGETRVDFMGQRTVAIAGSLVLIFVGLVAVSDRGKDLLNIDFTGGSSVTMVLKDDKKMTYPQVKELLDETSLKDKNLSLVEVGNTNTRYTVSSIEEDVEAVQGILSKTFGDRLQTYRVTGELVPSASEQTGVGSGPSGSHIRLVNFQEEQKPDNEQAVKAETAAVDQDTASSATEDEAKSTETQRADETEKTETKETDAKDTETEAEAEFDAALDPFANGTSAVLKFGNGARDEDAGVNYETVSQMIEDALKSTNHSGVAYKVENDNPEYQIGSARRFAEWEVKLALPSSESKEVLNQLEKVTNSHPVFPLANKIGGRVAGDLRTKALAAIVVSLLGIIAYIWFRFQKVMYGLAAVIALIHDVLVTLGMIALSSMIVNYVPGLAQALMIEKFQISLPIVAALLTIIGYSLNDTIVVFDRIREVKGKSPYLTREMINASINQTLSRTLLTSLTTLFSVLVLYIIGGDGIHGFAYALLVGIIVGTYSSIFIAAPILLLMSPEKPTAT